jgi:hypothetical protein
LFGKGREKKGKTFAFLASSPSDFYHSITVSQQILHRKMLNERNETQGLSYKKIIWKCDLEYALTEGILSE